MATSRDYSRSIIAASDEVKDILCEPCEQDGKQIEAEGFCVDCPEYLCGQCYKKHRRRRAFKDHVLQDKDKMPQSVTGIGVKDVCVQKCDKHPDEIIKYFCGSCDSLGCSTCMILDHRQCKNVVDIPILVTQQETKEECLTFIKEIEVISEQVHERKNTVKSIAEKNDDQEKEGKRELKRQRAEINKFFDDLEEDMDKKIEEIHSSNKSILTKAAKKYDIVNNDLMEIKSGIDTKQTVGQNCEVFIAMKRSKSNLKTVLNIGDNKIQKYKLYSSTEIQKMMKTITELCQMEIGDILLKADRDSSSGQQHHKSATEVFSTRPKNTSRKSNGEQLHGVTSSSQSQDLTNTSAKESSVSTVKAPKLDRTIDVRTSNDKSTPSLTALTLVHDHFIIAADGSNKSLKVIDTRTSKVTSEMIMEEEIWSVTTVENNEIAVGLDETIQLLSVSKLGSLRKCNVLHTSLTSYDLIYVKQNFFVAQGSGQLRVIDLQGKVLKIIDTDSDGEKLFFNCAGLAISPDKETLYVSDKKKDAVFSMTLEGKIKAIYRDSKLKRSWGVTVDNEGHVFVQCTQYVHQLSADLTKLQVFESYGMGITCSLTNTLYVGTSVLKVYSIK